MIYRVHGVDKEGNTVPVDIECDGEAVARNTAIRRGLTNTTLVELIDEESAVNVIRSVRRPAGAPRHRDTRSILPRFEISEAFKAGFGFGLGLAAASLLVGLAYFLFMLVFGGLFS